MSSDTLLRVAMLTCCKLILVLAASLGPQPLGTAARGTSQFHAGCRSHQTSPVNEPCLPGELTEVEDSAGPEERAVHNVPGVELLPIDCCLLFSGALKQNWVAPGVAVFSTAFSIGLPRGPPVSSS